MKQYQIVNKKVLTPEISQISVYAPLVAAKAKPGQFIILRVSEEGERIPLTIAAYDREKGTVSLLAACPPAGASLSKVQPTSKPPLCSRANVSGSCSSTFSLEVNRECSSPAFFRRSGSRQHISP